MPATRSGTKSAAAFRTISEVADELEVPQHVLRFWETKFGQIRPLKRGGGRRYYRPEDIDLLARRFLADFSSNLAPGAPPPSLNPETLQRLMPLLQEALQTRG